MSTEEHCDVLIIGAGIGGVYAAYRLSQTHPDLKVILVERSARVGGRLFSDDSDGACGKEEANKDELGGMRIFPKAGMQKVADLVKLCGLDLIPVPLGDQANRFQFRGENVRKGEARSPLGRTSTEMAKAAKEAYTKKHNPEGKISPYSCKILRQISVRQYLKTFGKATDEEVDWWQVYSGYDLYPDDVQASIFVFDGDLYGAELSDNQRYVKQGYMALVDGLLKKAGVAPVLNCNVSTIKPASASKDGRCVVKAEQGALYKISKAFHAKHVLVSVTRKQADSFNSGKGLPVSSQRREMMAASKALPLFKCFLQWDKDKVWWGAGQRLPNGKPTPYLHGKSTTDLAVRQVHYYDAEDLLIYNSGSFATDWHCKFADDAEGAAAEAFGMIAKLHAGEGIPPPDYSKTLHKYWPAGSHKWKRGADVAACVAGIPDGKTDASEVYVVGDAFSFHQGWVIGALDTVDEALRLLNRTQRAPVQPQAAVVGAPPVDPVAALAGHPARTDSKQAVEANQQRDPNKPKAGTKTVQPAHSPKTKCCSIS